jgi:hypothetical protein
MKRNTEGEAMNWKISRRMIRRLGLALAIAAFAAPAAQAMPVISDEGAVAAVPQVPVSHVVASGPTDSLGRPLTPPEPTDSLGRPLTPPEPTDSLGRPLSPPELVQPTSEVPSDSSWFDATHVGIGLFAIGLVLLGGAALIISRQNRRSRLAAA